MSQPLKFSQPTKPVKISPPHIMLKLPLTTPPRLFGTTTLPSSPRTPRWMLSQQLSAHQKLQLSHLFQICHGLQLLTLVASSKLPSKPNSRKQTPVHSAQPPNQPPTPGGYLLMPLNPSVDGDPGPLRS